MHAINQNCVKTMLRCGLIAAAAIWAMSGQTLVNLATQGRNVDFSNAPSTRPVKTGTDLPATCSVGDLFFQSSAPDGQNLYGCPTPNNWTLLGAPAVAFYQTVDNNATALTQEPALNFSSAFAATDDSGSSATNVDLALVNSSVGTFGSSSQVPMITVNAHGLITSVSTAPIAVGGGAAWGSITGTLSNQTDLEDVLNALQPAGNYLTALTGDVTASGPGSVPATLATINSGPGKCGDATHVCQVTTDGKGRVTAQAPVTITAGGTGTVTHTSGALTADQLIIGNGSGDITTGDLSGDVTTSGTTATILATINSGPGKCGDATHVCQVTTDGKGRVTTQTPVSITATTAWGSITGTLSSQTDLQTALGGKQAAGNYMTGLTGDGTASGPGSAVLTLATANSGPGQCGDATHVCQVTTDGKGRVTAQAPVTITAGGTGTVTHTSGALTADQLIIGNGSGDITTGDLTGDVTTSGTTATILATINSGPGKCGDATHVCQVTTDGKGRVTTQSPVSISATTAWGSITGTLSSQTDLQTALSGKQAAGNYITGLTGDGTASGPGSAVLTLVTANSGPGQCGDATHVCQVTTDGKGRVTAQAPVTITAGGTGTVTHTSDALTAGQLIIGNGSGDITTGDLTGDVTTSGTTATILATINSGPGKCGDATHVCQVTTDGKGRVTAQTPVSITLATTWGSITGTLSSQTDLQTALSGKQATGNYITGLSGDVSASGPGSVSATLATVNSGAGQCGDATHVCQVQTDAKGRVTAQTAIAIAAGGGNATSIQGAAVSSTAPANLQVLQYQTASNSYVPVTISGGASNWAAGALANIPGGCTPGSGVYLYFATDQPAGQQEYQCSSTNTWTQLINVGPSGALAIVGGSLDIVTSIVPRLPNTNTFSGSNSFTGPVFQIGGTSTNPGCAQAADIGKIWINTSSSINTSYQVCLAVSGTVQWVVK